MALSQICKEPREIGSQKHEAVQIHQNNNFSQISSRSDQCKREFETHHMTDDRKTDKRAYASKFTKAILDAQRKIIVELEAILKAMQV